MSLGSFDAQNVKNTESTEKNDYDGVKKILADGGYTAKPFAEKLKKFWKPKQKLPKEMNCMPLQLFLKNGLWKEVSPD